MPIYNKTRSRPHPGHYRTGGKNITTRILEEEYKKELRKKAFEELEEYIQAATDGAALEELADVLEIIHALAECHGSSIEQVEQIRAQKAKERSGFRQKIFLVEVHDG